MIFFKHLEHTITNLSKNISSIYINIAAKPNILLTVLLITCLWIDLSFLSLIIANTEYILINLLNVYYVSRTVLYAWHTFSHLIFRIILRGRKHCYLPFIDKERVAEKG